MFLQGLNSPFGITLVGHDLYVANSDAIVRFPCIDAVSSNNECQLINELSSTQYQALRADNRLAKLLRPPLLLYHASVAS